MQSEYGAWKGGKEGLYASTVSVSSVSSVSRVPESDWERGSPGLIGDKEGRL